MCILKLCKRRVRTLYKRTYSSLKKPPVAIVTGGSRGIGQRVAEGLANRGVSVAVISRNAEQHKYKLPQHGEIPQKHTFISCDVGNSSQVKDAVEMVERELGPVEILINGAGIAKDALLLHVKDEDLLNVMTVNVMGTVYMTRAITKSMLRHKKGVIVNIGSVVGERGDVGQTSYSASKAALQGLTRTWAHELGPKGIRVNMVSPGFILTSMTTHLTEDKKKEILSKTVLGRFGTCDDVWSAVEFLVANTFITGQNIIVDGGFRY